MKAASAQRTASIESSVNHSSNIEDPIFEGASQGLSEASDRVRAGPSNNSLLHCVTDVQLTFGRVKLRSCDSPTIEGDRCKPLACVLPALPRRLYPAEQLLQGFKK